MKEGKNYDNIIYKINQQLEKVKKEQEKYKQEHHNRYSSNNDERKKYSEVSSSSFSNSDYDQSLSNLSDETLDKEKYINIHNKNNDYEKSIERKKNQIDLLNKKMELLKKKNKV
ncbi:hypothetical protein LY90DRAFT_707196 [Neocallimastix californiae]|uniref:Uncharacterized protein n=1 Tax=Neocallimastix californiae TaxID=1754190 RepID=A0A1Y2AIK8_9FUNG|nr:hypothetical protein LY90DRAFT_707196 [Neocallimastix californiae]|eukprot:ORY22302.1 hypothetical protein LY90DRAFT_707196 [Neocallimastix californiae]